MSLQSLEEQYGYTPDAPPAPFGRYILNGWQYRVDTDGNGGTVEVREKWVGRGTALDVVAERRAIERNEARRQELREKYPDIEAAILEVLHEPMTVKRLAVEIGRRRYTAYWTVKKLHKHGRLGREWGKSEGGKSEYIWYTLNGNGKC